MKSDPQSLPDRRSVRLANVDYSQIGHYFLTVCAAEKRMLFGSMTDKTVSLNSIGKIAQSVWTQIPQHFQGVELGEFVIMPNHMHGIVSITRRARHAVPLPGKDRLETFSSPISGSIATMVRSFKAEVTRRVRVERRDKAFSVWQRGFYEHVIRDADEYANARRYIVENPKRFGLKKS